ncbi:MAG: ArsR family transcriptional regulator [Anaerolineae bacterium]|jgi:protein-tyrosine-phosphatase|nr:ArsR family transcriptional regulator [Anaerolineae bacterium]
MTAPELIKLLANEVRWALIQALKISDQRVNELVIATGQPANLVSYHLKKMRDDGLVSTRRSEADGRDVYYSLELARLRQWLISIAHSIHPALFPENPVPPQVTGRRVLFVCTHNSARSQMAEALLRHLSGGRITVMSAGSHPKTIHPDAIRTMDRLGIDLRQQHSRALDTVIDQTFDDVITVCDRAREVCPIVPVQGRSLHWGLPDPVRINDDQERAAAFEQTAYRLKTRIEAFLWTFEGLNI